MKPNRLLRLEEQIRKELGILLGPTSSDFRSLMIVVTHVKLSPDYRYGDVWISALGDHKQREEVITILTAKSGWIRHLLGNRLYIRHIPELRFHPDDTLERAARIDQILHREGLI